MTAVLAVVGLLWLGVLALAIERLRLHFAHRALRRDDERMTTEVRTTVAQALAECDRTLARWAKQRKDVA